VRRAWGLLSPVLQPFARETRRAWSVWRSNSRKQSCASIRVTSTRASSPAIEWASSNLPVLYVMSYTERVRIIYEHLNIILGTLLLLSFMVLTVSALGAPHTNARGFRTVVLSGREIPEHQFFHFR